MTSFMLALTHRMGHSKKVKIFSVSKGILNVKDNDTDLSKSGISVPVGKQKEAVDFMVNMSFWIIGKYPHGLILQGREKV